VARWNSERQNHGLEAALDHALIAEAGPALDGGATVRLEHPIRNINRTVGAMLSGQIARRFGHQGLPDETISVRFTGVAGQSFGAFLAHGVTLDLVGDANDYVGKGLSGGRVIVRQPPETKREPTENIIVGNTVLYGAIAGEAYLQGVAGERFAVRNSGAVAVVEGVGDHGSALPTPSRATRRGGRVSGRWARTTAAWATCWPSTPSACASWSSGICCTPAARARACCWRTGTARSATSSR